MKSNRSTLKYTVIAPMGDYMDDLFVGLREFPTENIFLISSEKRREQAERVKIDLGKFHVPSHVINIKGVTENEIWESTFISIGNITSGQMTTDLLVNVGTGDSTTRCAATTAAFANGLKAFAVSGEKIMMLPFMKFSYYKLIPDKKMELLKVLNENAFSSSFKDLCEKTNMSLPLISYHINGNLKSEGLKDMGLVDITQEGNRIAIGLSTLGRMIVGGYIKPFME